MQPLEVFTFVGVLGCTFAILYVAMRPGASEKMLQSRLEMIRQPTVDIGSPKLEIVRSPRPGLAARISERLEGHEFAKGLELLLCHAGSSASVGSVMLMSFVLAVAAGVAAHIFLGPLPLVLIAAAVGGSARYMALRFQRSRRLKKFNTALPDAIELMARALRAGHSMAAAIEIIAEQSPQPLAGEFSICFQQQKFGIPFRDALLKVGERVPSKDLHFLITAVLVQKETGGDLTDILDRTTHVIRDRIRIEGEIKTYTAQGRLTGWILSMLPVVMLGLINIITPGYSHILFSDPLGEKLLYGAGGLILLGGFVISRIVDIKV